MTNQIENLKREAKKLSRATSITHMQALDVLAVQRGHTHWGALADSVGRRPTIPGRDAVATPALGATPRELLEATLGEGLPDLARCRHLLISGATSTGKTTLFNRIVAAIPAGTGVTAIEDTRDLVLPDGAHAVTISRTAHPAQDEDAMAEAMARNPAILLVGEVTMQNARCIAQTMRRADGPMVASTIHSNGAANAIDAFNQRIAHTGRGSLPAGVAVVHIERDANGARRVTEIIASR